MQDIDKSAHLVFLVKVEASVIGAEGGYLERVLGRSVWGKGGPERLSVKGRWLRKWREARERRDLKEGL
ncbi:hypothetical protein E2C01_062651 [Portunus trituberculatus]|uniref:Uncharacterized protein n=1 Tax=Portunus trituberculatus TaxID=210409 RepID=A0A5B7HF91_PORTR|nr:hypothetical protein [Portunus trituberculatus]